MKGFKEAIDFLVLKCSPCGILGLRLGCKRETLASCSLCLRKDIYNTLFYFLLFFLPPDPTLLSRMLGELAEFKEQEGDSQVWVLETFQFSAFFIFQLEGLHSIFAIL